MPLEEKQPWLRQLPSLSDLLATEQAAAWLALHPRPLVVECLRSAVARVREAVLAANAGAAPSVSAAAVLERAGVLLGEATTPHLRAAINATGILLHTGLGRAVLPAAVVEGLTAELAGYVTLAVDRQTGERAERDALIEYILQELTGAEAATVTNNNAAATMLVLAALAAQREVIVSRGQLIEIGGSFRLPEVMRQSQARLVEVGSTNRTHLKDYRGAITENTAALMRVHPSNYRVVGFTQEVSLPELAELAHSRGLVLIDDLGAGALVDLGPFGLPHEPTVQESLAAGADVVLFSGDKLIGGPQAGIVVGRRPLVEKLRQHPLARAMRADKTCLMLLERTLHLFRRPERLAEVHPTYRMLATSLEALRARADAVVAEVARTAPAVALRIRESVAFLGSGSLPTEAIPSIELAVSVPGLSATELARRLREDPAAVFGRIEAGCVRLDMRTITDAEGRVIAQTLSRLRPDERAA